MGKVVSIQSNHKELDRLPKGQTAAIKIENSSNPTITYGRQFDHTHSMYSRLTRDSIDALKEHFKTDVPQEDWRLVVQIMKVQGIPTKASASSASSAPTKKEASPMEPASLMIPEMEEEEES